MMQPPHSAAATNFKGSEMAKIDGALTSGAYSTVTSALDLANTVDATKNDIIKLEQEIHHREVATLHQNMKKVAQDTEGLTF